MITVTDHGDGISPELLDKVFERGFSGDGSTGYGLSICRTIMDMHHGDISIRAGVDGGTVVEIVIYRKDNEDAENPAD
jgi:signal transduction histidine kinase